MPEPSPKTPVVSVAKNDDQPPTAEIRVAADRLFVTVPMAEARLSDSALLVASHQITIRSLPGRGKLNLSYPLPVRADPTAYVARQLNGVLDVVIMRPVRESV